LSVDRLAGMPIHQTEAERERRSVFAEAVGNRAAHLWVGQGRPAAHDWIKGWIADIVEGSQFTWHLVSALREALFLKYGSDVSTESSAIQDRARLLLDDVVSRSGRAMNDALAREQDELSVEERERLISLYKAGDQLINHATNQVYFGAGVFRNKNQERPGLDSHESMRAFLNEYASLLDKIGQTGTPSAIHHLVELYEYLIDAEPQRVFDLVAPRCWWGQVHERAINMKVWQRMFSSESSAAI
jgi:hypothetical protein